MPQRVRVAVSPPLLDLAMPDVTRRVTRAQFERWCLQSRELVGGGKPDALHDYRTAMRRLRTLLRSLGPWLPDVSPGSRRRLRNLMRLTGPARNLEVLLAWIEQHRMGLRPSQRIGARWLSKRIEVRLARLNAEIQKRLARKGVKVENRLRAELFASLRVVPSAPRASVVLRRLLRQETATLDRRLTAIRSMADRTVIHSARIAAKRVRYLLEPFSAELPDGTAMIQRLQELQDLVGGITDVHVAAEELRDGLILTGARTAERHTLKLLPWHGETNAKAKVPPPPLRAHGGLVALAHQLRNEGDEQFARFEVWLGEPKRTLLGLLRKAGAVNRGGRI